MHVTHLCHSRKNVAFAQHPAHLQADKWKGWSSCWNLNQQIYANLWWQTERWIFVLASNIPCHPNTISYHMSTCTNIPRVVISKYHHNVMLPSSSMNHRPIMLPYIFKSLDTTSRCSKGYISKVYHGLQRWFHSDTSATAPRPRPTALRRSRFYRSFWVLGRQDCWKISVGISTGKISRTLTKNIIEIMMTNCFKNDFKINWKVYHHNSTNCTKIKPRWLQCHFNFWISTSA